MSPIFPTPTTGTPAFCSAFSTVGPSGAREKSCGCRCAGTPRAVRRRVARSPCQAHGSSIAAPAYRRRRARRAVSFLHGQPTGDAVGRGVEDPLPDTGVPPELVDDRRSRGGLFRGLPAGSPLQGVHDLVREALREGREGLFPGSNHQPPNGVVVSSPVTACQFPQ